MHKVTQVEPLSGYRLAITFDDGVHGVADVSHLAGKGVFSLWSDWQAFKDVRIGSSGELLWNDQVDLCPDALYLKVTGKTVEEVFPAVNCEPSHA